MRIALPPPVPESDPPPFPLAGVLAPLVASALLFAITRSPLTLAFAALSPVMVVASLLDGRRGRRRALRRAEARRSRILDRVRADVAAAQ
ncbi:MAG: cell division protein FtsK, partial [Naasia sp.]|nr:cell division protein FtsK [Naasia sp.]